MGRKKAQNLLTNVMDHNYMLIQKYTKLVSVTFLFSIKLLLLFFIYLLIFKND